MRCILGQHQPPNRPMGIIAGPSHYIRWRLSGRNRFRNRTLNISGAFRPFNRIDFPTFRKKPITDVRAAVGLHFAHYNFVRQHKSLRVTPAMQLGVTDHIWSIGELVEAASTGVTPEPQGRKVGRFTVIDGGL